ncbi:hypothetical protein SCHPADRAFT_239899 [Schizopora paradoxa]|uniref:Zn(2)-C6 fungal-type domain-containing protein n=1 Tax=Schizopora paradoxa TaxID=27342 RepID=A0A0H2RVJ5_9AGAM|nr:hypothetical protein SCHPADRAFT_239899 [Schizopora paradoxa]
MEIDPPSSREGEFSVIASAGGGTPGNSESATNAGSSSHKVKMRRHRVVLSCKPCHMHKQKCDRQYPCSRCIKRGDPALCIYENGPLGPSTPMRPSASASGDLAQRVAQLESLVQASLGGQTKAQLTPPAPNPLISNSETTGASESAVQVAAAALGELSQQQDRVQDVEEIRTPKISPFQSALPQRACVEELLTFFFDYSSFNQLWHVIHRLDFDRSYVAFMSRTDAINTDFFALLNAVCASALQLTPEGHQGSPAFPKDSIERRSLKNRVLNHAQSTLASESGRPPTLERVQGFMILAIFHLNEGNFWSCYDLSGTAIRAAQFLGMNRDPATLWPNMAPDEVEVRRRLWAGLCVLDRKVSLLLKRPHIIQESVRHCSTYPPANADEHTITTSTNVLVKPMSEPTSHAFHILQLLWAKTTRRLADECFGNTRPSYSTILSIERETLQFEAQIPQAFKDAAAPDLAKGSFPEALRFQALYLMMDVYHARLKLTRYFVFSQSSSELDGSSGVSKDRRNVGTFESSARNLSVANCKRILSLVTVAINEWKKNVPQHLRWAVLVLITFDAALHLTLCELRRFARPPLDDAYTWVSLAASVFRELHALTDNSLSKNALTLTEVLLEKLSAKQTKPQTSPRSTPGPSVSEGLELAVRTLLEARPTMDGLLSDCKDCDALWLTTTASVFEAYFPGPESLSLLDVPTFEHFLNSCTAR